MSKLITSTGRLVTNTAWLAALAGGAYWVIRDSANNVLATLPLPEVAGTLAPDGTLTLAPGARDEEAALSGTPHHARLMTAANAELLRLDAVETLADDPDVVVVAPFAIIAGFPVELVSAVIG